MLWLVRGGKFGEFEEHFLSHDRICLTWEELDETDLSGAKAYEDIKKVVQEAYPSKSVHTIGNWSGQIASFVLDMVPGDWVILPRKNLGLVAVGEIAGPYQFDSTAESLYMHARKVKWINREVPRSAFQKDLLYLFGAFMTICRIQKHDAEQRVRAMAKAGWKVSSKAAADPVPDGEEERRDLAELARIEIAQRIERNYKGHGLARLVEAILQSQGYTTHLSPAGPDKGLDILAAPDALGFGSPRICVQVKSGDQPIDRQTLDQLVGVMQNVGAEQGLLVSWSGFKSSVTKEIASQFFKVRLWDATDVIKNLLDKYPLLSDEHKAELPLRQIWIVADPEE